MIYPESIENKIGFSVIRDELKKYCVTPTGRAFVDNMSMMTDFESVKRSLCSTAEMLTIVQGENNLPLTQLTDITPLLKTLSVGGTFLSAAEMVEVRSMLCVVSALHKFFMIRDNEDAALPYPYLAELVSTMTTFDGCISSINRVIDRYGNIHDNASPELAEIRRQLTKMSGRVNSVMRNVIAAAQRDGLLDADAAPTMRDGRLVLPVAPMNKRKINGIVHDESASGKTLFIEPAEVVEANNQIRELELGERREIARILATLADEIRPYAQDIESSSHVVAEVDFIQAKARFAADIDACMPHISPNPELEWYHACHPGLLLSLRKHGKEIVPLDIMLTKTDRILVISGPNAGGKSVCLKTVGVIQYMTQCGLLPAVYENSHMGIFDDIFIDIGDDQSIENDLSTYSSHLRNMKLLLQKGRATSLLLIDEFGSGTEPQIGGALAQAILRKLNSNGMWGLITTHYQNLKHFAEDTEGLINGSMLYDRQRMQPLFKLSIGNPGSSFAVEIARKTGLPKEIIDEAEEIVGSDYINMDKYLLDIARDKKYWENKRQAIRLKEKKIEQVLERYENDAETLRLQRKVIISEAKDEAMKIIAGSNATIERTIHEIRKSQADREKTLEARRKLAEEKKRMAKEKSSDPELLKKAPKKKRHEQHQPNESQTSEREIKVGDVVKLDGEGTPGKVIELQGKNAVVVFGMLKTSVAVKRLKHTLAKIPVATTNGGSTFISTSTADSIRARQLNFKQDIDVRGMRVDEGIQAITYFIDDAVQFNASRVRILHGTGTGALRQAIREYLDTVSSVRSYRDENVQFGGAGITVVELE